METEKTQTSQHNIKGEQSQRTDTIQYQTIKLQ